MDTPPCRLTKSAFSEYSLVPCALTPGAEREGGKSRGMLRPSTTRFRIRKGHWLPLVAICTYYRPWLFETMGLPPVAPVGRVAITRCGVDARPSPFLC